MKLLKRLLLFFLVLVVLLVGAAVAIPFLFKDKIVALVKTEINQSIRADVDFDDVDISFFRHFPKLSLGLDNLTVTGRDTFAGYELARIDRADLAFDLMSVISNDGPVRINSVALERPVVQIKVLKNGLANYDIALDTPPDTVTTDPAEAVGIDLESYAIRNGRLLYDDKATNTFVDVRGLHHSGSGDFSAVVYDLDTETEIDSLTLAQGGVAYLTRAHATLDAIFNIDTENSVYRLQDNALRINELVLNASGELQLLDDEAMRLDFAFDAPSNDFGQLWSIIPNAYTQGYENLQTSGQFTLEGFVKGILNTAKEQYPAFHVKTNIENGNVKYPDLPVGINAIYANVDVNSPTERLNDMVIDIPNFGLQLDGDPIKGSFRLATPISDPQMKASLVGKLDLERWSQAFPVDGVTQLAGLIDANVNIDTRLSTIEAEDYDNVSVGGDLTATNVVYVTEGVPGVKVDRLSAEFTPQRVNIPNFSMQVGNSDIRGQGQIDNFLAYFSPEKVMKGSFVLESNYFDANEWIPETPAPAQGLMSTGATAQAVVDESELFDRFAFDISAKAAKIDYDIYELSGTEAVGAFSPDYVRIDAASTRIGESDFFAVGHITNVWDYTFNNDILGGDISVSSRQVNLNDFMVEPATGQATNGTAAAAEYGVVPVPERMTININAKVDKLIYTDLVLSDMTGLLVVDDEQMTVQNGKAKMLGGDIDFSGAYDTRNLEDPEFNFKYDMQQVEFAQAFNYLNTFKALAPIGKFINGRFNSSLILSGKLGQDMLPNLSTLNAEGFMMTLDAVVNNFKPIQVIGNALNINELKSQISLKNIKSYFSIVDGKVAIKPFDVNVKDLSMIVSGTHGLTQEMAYDLKTTIPRKYIEGNAVGAAVSQGVDKLLGQASKLGINIERSENVNVLIKLTGSLTDPKVGFDLLGANGEASAGEVAQGALQNVVDEQKQVVRNEVNQRVDSVRNIAQDRVNQARDSAKTVVQKEVDDARKRAEQQAKEKLGGVVDSALLNNDTKEAIEDKLKKFNPFKKKKDGG